MPVGNWLLHMLEADLKAGFVSSSRFTFSHQLHFWCCMHWVTRPKNFIETDTETFFRDQNFRDRDRDFFSRPNIFETDTETFFETKVFETDTETFFWDQIFLRPIPRIFFETKSFRDRYRDFFSRPNVFETDTETFFETKGLASQCKAQEKYKERLDLGVTWLKWLPTGMESKTRLAPRSNKVNSQKLTLNWNTSLYYRVLWKWRQSAFHANNHAIGGGSNGIIHLGWRPHTFLLHTNIDSTNSNTNRTNITEMAFKRFAVEIRLLLLKKCSHWKRWSTITSTGRTD